MKTKYIYITLYLVFMFIAVKMKDSIGDEIIMCTVAIIFYMLFIRDEIIESIKNSKP